MLGRTGNAITYNQQLRVVSLMSLKLELKLPNWEAGVSIKGKTLPGKLSIIG
jgi:hypothetical protein